MRCKDVNKILSKYIDGSLSDENRKAIELHLDNCSLCYSKYTSVINTLNLLKPTKNIEEHAFYYTRLKQKMESNLIQKSSVLTRLFNNKIMQPALYLSSVIIAVFIGIQIGSYSGNSEQYSELNIEEQDYIKVFSENKYLNDFEIESIENTLINNDSLIQK
jgi:predicted anti-sigma-YlaC factor YlaD